MASIPRRTRRSRPSTTHADRPGIEDKETKLHSPAMKKWSVDRCSVSFSMSQPTTPKGPVKQEGVGLILAAQRAAGRGYPPRDLWRSSRAPDPVTGGDYRRRLLLLLQPLE